MQKNNRWCESGYPRPAYDREAMVERTQKDPWWIHFGAGNIFRAFPARVADELLDKGVLDRGVLVVEGFDEELLAKAYEPFDHYSIAVTLKADGTMDKRIVGSVAGSFCIAGNVAADGMAAQPECSDWNALCHMMEKASLQMLSFTITEKGYAYRDGAGKVFGAVEADCQAGPFGGQGLVSYMGKVTALLYHRYQTSHGSLGIALVSMDNCSANGKKLSEVICFYAENWVRNGLAEAGFLRWLRDETKVSFPWSMIDKITPRPDAEVQRQLEQDGLTGMEPIITSKNTYTAPFVNAEECEYLVIEDSFPAGRPALEQGGFYFTDRATVKKAERMKVSTCLNPLHTALAVFGCLFGYDRIYEEMKDAELVSMVKRLGYVEGMPVVTDPGILKPEQFLREVLELRLPNRFMPDSPWRIATDTSQKLAVRFGETVKEYQKRGMSLDDLTVIPLVYAGWLRYLCGVNDKGEAYEVSADPKLAELESLVKTLRERLFAGRNAADEAKCDGQTPQDVAHYADSERNDSLRRQLNELFAREDIFGLSIAGTVLAEKAEDYLLKMLEGPGAVRTLLQSCAEAWK